MMLNQPGKWLMTKDSVVMVLLSPWSQKRHHPQRANASKSHAIGDGASTRIHGSNLVGCFWVFETVFL